MITGILWAIHSHGHMLLTDENLSYKLVVGVFLGSIGTFIGKGLPEKL